MSWSRRGSCLVLVFAMTAVLRVAAADDTQARLNSAATVLNKLTDSSGHGIQPEQLASADCVEGRRCSWRGLWPGIYLLPQRGQLVSARRRDVGKR